jgi:hypothetical protein
MNTAKHLSINVLAKILLEYAFWLIVALALGICYMYLVLGTAPEPDGLIGFVVSQIHFFVLTRVGVIIGGIVFLLFLTLDITLFKSKIKSFQQLIAVRIFALLVLTKIVGLIHYLMEKTLDLI